jgi:nicotinamidase-related amidase
LPVWPANFCCESTGRHTTEEGYDVTFISDAIGAAGVMEYEAAININFPVIANAVIKTDDFLDAIETAIAAVCKFRKVIPYMDQMAGK